MAAILEQIGSPNFSRDDELPISFQEPSIDPLDSSESSSEESPFQMTRVADTLWTFVFSTMIVSAIFGNLVVFWIVLGND